ncbi:hypothetical protein AB0425_00890 [Actinosynnema sp. NPDC051121]
MSDADFAVARRRLAELNARYLREVRDRIPDPREFYDAARRRFAELPDLSANGKLDGLRAPRPGGPVSDRAIADCTEWLDVAIAFESVAILELAGGDEEAADLAHRMHEIAHVEAVACAQLEV